MKYKKQVLIVGIIGLIIIVIFIINKPNITGNTINNQQVEIVPLSSEEQTKVAQVLLSSEFIKDVPKKIQLH